MKSDFPKENRNNKNEYSAPKVIPDGKSGPFRWSTVSFGEALLNSVSRAAIPVSAIILIVYICTGKWAEALLLLGVLTATVFLTAYLCYRSGKMYSEMCKNLVSPSYVRRDGRNVYVKWYDIREDDILFISPGSVIPADVMLVSGGNVKVLEQYFDYDNNKRAVRKVEKIPGASVGGESDEKSLILAGSTVISGHGRAAVVALGNDTEISKRLGGIKIAPQDYRTPSIRKTVKNAQRFSDFRIATAIVVTISYIIAFSARGGTGMGLLAFALIEMALIISSIDKNNGSIYDFLMLDEFTRAPHENDEDITSFSYYLPGKCDEISEADTLLILEHSVIADMVAEVRAAFFNSKEYSGIYTGSGELTGLSEKALLLKTVRTSVRPENEYDLAFDGFADVQNADPDYLLHNVSKIERKLDFPNKDDVSALVEYRGEKSKSETVTGTFDTGVLSRCRFFRDTDNGLLPCDLAFEDAYKAFLAEMDKRCLVPVVITSCASGGDILVLEGILAVGGMFPEVNNEVKTTLADYGIHTVAVIEEDSPDSVYAAGMCGIADTDSNIAVASEYKKNGLNITSNFEAINVFSGFGSAGTSEICKKLKEDGHKTLAVVGDSISIKQIPDDSVPVAVRENTQGSVNLRCAASVRPGSEYSDCTGINAVLSLIFSSVCARMKNIFASKYICFKTAFLVCSVAIPMFAGMLSLVPSPFVILFSSLFSDAVLLCVTRLDTYIPQKLEISKSIFKKCGNVFDTLITASMGIISALAMTVTGALELKANDGESMNAYLFLTMLLLPVLSLGGQRLFARLKLGLISVNIAYIISVVLCMVLTVACVIIPAGSSQLWNEIGWGLNGYRLIWLCAVPSVISFIATFGSGFIPIGEERLKL